MSENLISFFIAMMFCLQTARILLFIYMFYHVYTHYDQVIKISV